MTVVRLRLLEFVLCIIYRLGIRCIINNLSTVLQTREGNNQAVDSGAPVAEEEVKFNTFHFNFQLQSLADSQIIMKLH